jgi:hypothetical protein
MNARFASLSNWADQLFDLFPVTSFHVSTPSSKVSSTAFAFTSTNTSNAVWTGSGDGYLINPTYPTVEWYTPVTKYVTDYGTPWDKINGFPPVRIELNKDTKSLRFTWALAGIDKELVDIEFDEDRMILSIKKKEEKKDDKKDKEWVVLRNTIKANVFGEYAYDIPQNRFNVAYASAKWEGDLLVAEIPVKDEKAPVKVKISK